MASAIKSLFETKCMKEPYI